MKQITITQLLLFTTWIALAIVIASRFVGYPAYPGVMNDEGAIAYEFLVNDLDLDAARKIDHEYPIWNSTDPNPPLSTRSALAKADEYKRNRLEDTSEWGWALDSLTLCAIDGKNGKWCWCVHFTAYFKRGVVSGHSPEVTAYILMNGKVVGESSPLHEFKVKNGLIKSGSDLATKLDQ